MADFSDFHGKSPNKKARRTNAHEGWYVPHEGWIVLKEQGFWTLQIHEWIAQRVENMSVQFWLNWKTDKCMVILLLNQVDVNNLFNFDAQIIH